MSSPSSPHHPRRVVTSSGRVISIKSKTSSSPPGPAPQPAPSNVEPLTISILTNPTPILSHSHSHTHSHSHSHSYSSHHGSAASHSATGSNGSSSSATGGHHAQAKFSPARTPHAQLSHSHSASGNAPAPVSSPIVSSSPLPERRLFSSPSPGLPFPMLGSNTTQAQTPTPTPAPAPTPAPSSAVVPDSSKKSSTPSLTVSASLPSLPAMTPSLTALLSSVTSPATPLAPPTLSSTASSLLAAFDSSALLGGGSSMRRRRTAGFGQGLAALEKKKGGDTNETTQETQNTTAESAASKEPAAPAAEPPAESATATAAAAATPAAASTNATADAATAPSSAPASQPVDGAAAPVVESAHAMDIVTDAAKPTKAVPPIVIPPIEPAEPLVRAVSNNSSSAAASPLPTPTPVPATPAPPVETFPAHYKLLTKSDILQQIQRLDHELHDYERELDKLEFDLEMLAYHGGNEARLDREEDDDDNEQEKAEEDEEQKPREFKRIRKSQGLGQSKARDGPQEGARHRQLSEAEIAILKELEAIMKNINNFAPDSFTVPLDEAAAELARRLSELPNPLKAPQPPLVTSSLIAPPHVAEKILYENQLRAYRSHSIFHRVAADVHHYPDILAAPEYYNILKSFPRFRHIVQTVLMRANRRVHGRCLRLAKEWRKHDAAYQLEKEKFQRAQWTAMQNQLNKRTSRNQRATSGGNTPFGSSGPGASGPGGLDLDPTQFPPHWYFPPGSAELAAKERELQLKRAKYARCAAVPPDMLTVNERKLKANEFINRNCVIEDMEAEAESFYTANPWTDREKRIFVSKYMKFPKQFRKIAQFLPQKSVNECIGYYYYSKLAMNYKENLKLQAKAVKGGKGKGKNAGQDDDDEFIDAAGPNAQTPAAAGRRGAGPLATPGRPLGRSVSATPGPAAATPKTDKISRELIGLAIDLSNIKAGAQAQAQKPGLAAIQERERDADETKEKDSNKRKVDDSAAAAGSAEAKRMKVESAEAEGAAKDGDSSSAMAVEAAAADPAVKVEQTAIDTATQEAK